MCNIDRVYRGATKPFRPNLKGSRYFSSSATFQDEDPVLAGDTADDAAYKLSGLLSYYNRLPNSKKFVEEQRLKTKATGVVQYACEADKLHHEQAEFRRLLDCRIETVEAQVAIIDHDIQHRNGIRRDCDRRDQASRPPKTECERVHLDQSRKRADYFAERREQIHQNELDGEFFRCDEMQRITLHDQAVEERVHQHRNLRKLAFAREWTKRRVRWQLNNNSITQNRNEWNEATLGRQQAASDRVETQHLIRQKLIEYRRELTSLKRLYADLAAKREKSRQEFRGAAVSSEFSRMSLEEAVPSPSPIRRKAAATQSAEMAPFSHLLKQPRVVRRIARFDFGRTGGSAMGGSGFLSNSTTSTRSGNWSLGGSSTMRQSMSMPSLGGSTTVAEQRELQRALEAR